MTGYYLEPLEVVSDFDNNSDLKFEHEEVFNSLKFKKLMAFLQSTFNK